MFKRLLLLALFLHTVLGATDIIPLYIQNGQYEATLYIGTPLQTQRFLFTLDNADAWIGDVLCQTAACLAMPFTFNPAASSSYVGTNEFQLLNSVFGTSVLGNKASDGLSYNILETTNLPTLNFVNALSVSSEIIPYATSGVIGGGLQASSQSGMIGPAYTLTGADQELGISLQGLSLVIGDVDTASSLFVLPFITTPVFIADGSWNFQLINFYIETLPTYYNNKALLDINTNLIVVPKVVGRFIAEYLGATIFLEDGYEQYQLPNCGLTSLPTIFFTTSGGDVSMDPPQYILQLGPSDCRLYFAGKDEFVGGQQNQPFWRLGQPFMRSFFVKFDVGNELISFASLP